MTQERRGIHPIKTLRETLGRVFHKKQLRRTNSDIDPRAPYWEAWAPREEHIGREDWFWSQFLPRDTKEDKRL